jgi:uncharacterized membrane protein YeaQ/YmgE (transglycosylase-associated protein family)
VLRAAPDALSGPLAQFQGFGIVPRGALRHVDAVARLAEHAAAQVVAFLAIIGSIITATVGAVILLLVVGLIKRSA